MSARTQTLQRLERIETYKELKSWGVSKSEIIRRMGISERTYDRYSSYCNRHRN